eukprot:m51a1_g296 hypothetical protein (182) ;mRNA; f:357870-358520
MQGSSPHPTGLPRLEELFADATVIEDIHEPFIVSFSGHSGTLARQNSDIIIRTAKYEHTSLRQFINEFAKDGGRTRQQLCLNGASLDFLHQLAENRRAEMRQQDVEQARARNAQLEEQLRQSEATVAQLRGELEQKSRREAEVGRLLQEALAHLSLQPKEEPPAEQSAMAIKKEPLPDSED